MAYRMVRVCIWNDEKFLSLTDSGKFAFLMLLTHPYMTSVGAMRGNLMGLAYDAPSDAPSEGAYDALSDAPSDAVKARIRGFNEIIKNGMVEYDKAGLIALPNFLKHNPPSSSKNVSGWKKVLDSLPECELKNRVIARCNACEKILNTPSDAPSHAPSDAPSEGVYDARVKEYKSNKTSTPLPPKSGGDTQGKNSETEKIPKTKIPKTPVWAKGHQPEVVEAARTICNMWPNPRDGDLQPSSDKRVPGIAVPEVAARLSAIRNEGGNLSVCVEIAKRAVDEYRIGGKWIKAPQHFFGNSKEAPWKAYYQAHVTNQAINQAATTGGPHGS